jgi:hypothetical protein
MTMMQTLQVMQAVHDAAVHMATPTQPPGGGLPDLGGGTAPPGSDKLVTILRWVMYGVSLICVGGVLGVAGRMAWIYRSHGGGGGEAMTGLTFVLFGAALAGSATAIVGALL